MTYVNPKNSSTPSGDTLSDPSEDYYGDFGEDFGAELDIEVAMDDFGGEAGGPAAPMSADEMRIWLKGLLDQGRISQEEYRQRSGEVNRAVNLPDEKRAQVFSEIHRAYAPAAEGGDSFSDIPDVTSKQITDLMNEIKSGHVQPMDEEMTKEQCIATLTQALQDEKSNNGNRAAAEFREVLEACGGAEAIDPKNLAAAQLGETPVSIDKDGTFRFDGRAPEANADLNLRSPGDGSKVVVDNASTVSLTPKNLEDEVVISEEGNYYVIQMGSDTFKVNKDAKLTIFSDHVSGSVDNTDKNITVGANSQTSQNYVDPSQLNELAGKITSGAEDMGPEKTYHLLKKQTTYVPNPSGYGSTIKVEYVDNIEHEDMAKKILNDMAAALKETDPKKRAEAWEAVSTDLLRLSSQGLSPGHVNDIAQLVFNILYDKMGEAGLKDALKQGIIPTDVVNKLSAQLLIKPDENTTDDYKHAYGGGPSWTHQTSADFLTQHGGTVASSV